MRQSQVEMPKEARRKRRSLPSAIERNLSLEELLGEEQQSAKKKERQAKEQQALQLMASVRHAELMCYPFLERLHFIRHSTTVVWSCFAYRQYYSMIDNVELAVEDTSSSASVSSTSGSESSPAKKNETRRIARKRERSATSLSTECGAKGE